MNIIPSYVHILNLGQSTLEPLLQVEVNVESKIDGSQFSWMVDNDESVYCRTKNQLLSMENTDKGFLPGVEAVKSVAHLLRPNWIYRGEYLRTPRHNAIRYNRTPKNHVIIFDIRDENGRWLSYPEKAAEALRIGYEVVPLLYQGKIESIEQLEKMLQTECVLGGHNIEGVVIKPSDYNVYDKHGDILFGKLVSKEFRELHFAGNPTKSEIRGNTSTILEDLVQRYPGEPRWIKAIQRLTDGNQLTGDGKDIALILREVLTDTHREIETDVKEILWKWAWNNTLSKRLVEGLGDWYKERLLSDQRERLQAA